MTDQNDKGGVAGRRRSSSESRTGRLNSTLDENGTSLISFGESNINVDQRSPSVPNLLSTRRAVDASRGHQGGRNPQGGSRDVNRVHIQVVDDLEVLKEKFNQWKAKLETLQISRDDRNKEFNDLHKQIIKLAQDALCSSIDRSVYSEIRTMKENLERANRVAERNDRTRSTASDIHNRINFSQEQIDEVFGTADDTVQQQTTQTQSIIQQVGVEDQDETTEEGSETMQEQQLIENIASLRNQAVHGFAPAAEFTNNETVIKKVNQYASITDRRLDKLEFTLLANTVRVGRIETHLIKAQQDIVKLREQSDVNYKRVSVLENNVMEQDKNRKQEQTLITDRIQKMESVVQKIQGGVNEEETRNRITDYIKATILRNDPGQQVESLKRELKELKRDVQLDQTITEGLRELVTSLNEKMKDINQPINLGPSPTTFPTNADILDVVKSARECDIIKNSIERSAGLIRQLIATDLSNVPIEISLIKKCKVEDAPAVQKAVTATEASLVKYIKFPGMNIEFFNDISNLLQTAGAWCLDVEAKYAKMEVHAVNTSRGDTRDVGIFKDNFEQTIYEFLDDLEAGFGGWGTNKQRGGKLYNKHLSGPLRTKHIDKSDDYSKLRDALITDFGRSDRIVNDMLAGLMKKRKPAGNNTKERLGYFSDILSALQRIQKLRTGNQIDCKRLDECLYSRGTLSTLMSLLPDGDLEEFIRILTKENRDWNNPAGLETFSLFKQFCEIERNAMESARDQGGSAQQKPRSRNAHGVHKKGKNSQESSSEEEQEARVHAATTNKFWFQTGLKFPCPLNNHKHEIAKCKEFLVMNPVDRWAGIERRRICFTCMQPKAVCVGGKCSSQQKVPEVLLCKGCEVDAQARGGPL